MYIVYILQNSQGFLYKGHTNNLERRLKEHNLSKSKHHTYTRKRGPWKLVYKEEFATRSEAMKREKYFKTTQGRRELKKLIDQHKE